MNNKLKDEKIDHNQVNEVVGISKKILNLLYIVMVIGIIFLVTLLAKEWGILNFFVTLLKVATPFFIGFAIAWLFNPIVVKLERDGIRRGLAACLVYVCFLALLVIFFWFLIPTIYNQLNDLITSLPSIINSLKEGINDAVGSLSTINIK